MTRRTTLTAAAMASVLVATVLAAPASAAGLSPAVSSMATAGTIGEQRTALRAAYSRSLQEISAAQADARTLSRGQSGAFATAVAGMTVTMRAAAAAVTSATNQAQVDAAAKLVRTESIRSATAKQAATKLVRLQTMRREQVAIANKALQDKLAGTITGPVYAQQEARATAFSTLLSVAATAQLQTVGKAVPSPALTVEPAFTSLKAGTGSITAAPGWTGFPGGFVM